MAKEFRPALLGLSSYAFRWAFGYGDFRPARPMTAQHLIDVAASAGLDVVQLCDNVPLLSFSREELQAVRDHASERSIQVETGLRGIGTAALAKALEVTEFLGADLLRIVVEIDRADKTAIGMQLDRAAAALASVLPRAKDLGIRLAIENHASMAASDMARLLDAVADPDCGACLDTMNSVLLIERPEETVDALARYVFSVHLKDFRLTKEADGYRIEGTALGDGILDLPNLVRAIDRRGQVRSWHAELYVPGGADEEDTLTKERRAVDRSIVRLLELRPLLSSPQPGPV